MKLCFIFISSKRFGCCCAASSPTNLLFETESQRFTTLFMTNNSMCIENRCYFERTGCFVNRKQHSEKVFETCSKSRDAHGLFWSIMKNTGRKTHWMPSIIALLHYLVEISGRMGKKRIHSWSVTCCRASEWDFVGYMTVCSVEACRNEHNSLKETKTKDMPFH